MTATSIFLIEIDCIDPVTLVRNTLQFSTGAAYMSGPKALPANTVYEGRVLDVGNFERHCWQRDTTRGQSTVGYGNTIIDNSDQELDVYKNFGFDGQAFRILEGDDANLDPSTFAVLFTGTMQAVVFGWSNMEILVRDRLAEIFALPIQTALYGGTNVLPAGFDGVAADLQGKPKPILLGSCLNMPVPCVNTSLLTYQITDRAKITIGSVAISAVYDKGVALTAGTAFATIALLQASTPAAAHYNWCDDPAHGAFIQLGSTPAGELTVDASEGTAASATIAQIVTRILTGPGGQPASQITGAGALDAAASAQVGYWCDTTVQAMGDVITAILQTCNGYLVNQRSGPWLMGLLLAPAGAPALTVTLDDIKDPSGNGINIVQSNDLGSDAPATNGNTPSISVPLWQVIMNYGLNNQVQSSADIAGAALTRLGFVAQQYRQAVAFNAAILQLHELAAMVTFTGLFVTAAAALAEALRQLALRGVHRDVIEIVVDPSFAASADLGSIIALDIPRFDWLSVPGGKLFVCIGMLEDFGATGTAAKTTLVLWG